MPVMGRSWAGSDRRDGFVGGMGGEIGEMGRRR